MPDPIDPIERQKAQAEADKAQAEADKAQAAAVLAQAEADKARAEADKAAAEARKGELEAAKLQAEIDESLETDPVVIEARKQARLAELSKEQAEAKAAAEKSAVPEAPTLAPITEPTDKSITMADTAGVATARWTATQAMALVGDEIARRTLVSIGGAQQPPKLASVCVMDTTSVSDADLLRLQLTARLDAFIAAFSPPVVPPHEPPQGEEGGRPAGDAGAVAAAAAITTASNVVRFGVELVGALRTRYAIFGREVTLDRSALLARIVSGLVREGAGARWPRYAPVTSSVLMVKFGQANALRDEFEARSIPDGPATDTEPRHVKAARQLVSAFDKYATAITSAGATGERSPLVEAALIEAAVPAATSADEIMLFVDISAQGADAVTGYGVLKGSSASFVGFVQAYYVLAKRDGAILGAGTVTRHVAARLELDTANLIRTA